jgi:hypothetical protein
MDQGVDSPVPWGELALKGVFSVRFPASLLGGFSRALWDLKTGGNLPGTPPPKFPPIVSRDIFSALCPIWRPQQPLQPSETGHFF